MINCQQLIQNICQNRYDVGAKNIIQNGRRLERHELRSDLRPAQPYHSSDGCLTPEALVHRAVEMRVGPWRSPTMTPQLQSHQQERKFTFGTGAESYSRRGNFHGLGNHEIHIVGLNIDITHPLMCESSRSRQNGAISGRSSLPKDLKSANTWGAGRRATTGSGRRMTRGHFARFLVECGKASSMAMSLKSIWRAGKPDTFRHSGVNRTSY